MQALNQLGLRVLRRNRCKTEAMSRPEDQPGEREQQVDRCLVSRYLAGSSPAELFEHLYATGAGWNRAEPHPLLTQWTSQQGLDGRGRSAIVVGCGLGADAEHIASLGFNTVAFDISPTAVRLARERHPESTVHYLAADLLALPAEWTRAFDLVIEIITVQAVPDQGRRQAIINVSSMVAPGGTLFVVAWRFVDGAPPPPPWPLRRTDIDAFASEGVTPVQVDELVAPGERFEPRWRAEFRREPAGAGQSG